MTFDTSRADTPGPLAGAERADVLADPCALVDDRPGDGVFRVHRAAFRDPQVHALELERIFERAWVFVAHESQLPAPHDYLTTTVGRHPVVMMRDERGALNAFVNSCRHKGATICTARRGRARVHVCRYHGWSYASDGRNVAIKSRAQGEYADAFDRDSHDLAPVPRFARYRGFCFASFDAHAVPLEDWLGDARVFIDMIVDASGHGVELVPGEVSYTYEGNWKLQLENSLDAYHFTSTHPSYLRLLERRAAMGGRTDVAAAVWQGDGTGRALEDAMGSFGFEHGHALVWTNSPPQRHPLYAQLDALRARVGEVRAEWMLRTRQLDVFPNLQLASNASAQMRVIRPLGARFTEVRSYCVAPVGEDREARRRRIRQYEDFFNPSGLATPDDTAAYEACQSGYASDGAGWLQGHARGMRRVRAGADAHAASLGIAPVQSTEGAFEMADETVFHPIWRAWRRMMCDEGER